MTTPTTATTTISPQRIQALQNTLRTLLSPEWVERLNLDGYRSSSSSSSSCSLMDIGVNTQTCSDVQFYSELLRAKAAGVDHVVLTGTDFHRNQAGWRRVQEYNNLLAAMTIQANDHTEKNNGCSLALLSLMLPKLYLRPGFILTPPFKPHPKHGNRLNYIAILPTVVHLQQQQQQQASPWENVDWIMIE
jgi:hypothetical protein